MSKINLGAMIVNIEGNTSGINNAVATAQMKATNAFKKVGSAASGMITGAVVATLSAVAIAMVAGAKAAVDFESAFAGVRKTLDATPQQFKQVSDELINMARFLPQTATELAAIAQVAGQLGVQVDDVAKFTEVIAKLGGATDLAGEMGATSMARFMKVIGQPIKNTEAFANVLVELGNNTATTESEIIQLALNFGALGSQVGLTGEEILAFSAAMREMGQPAAAGATALNKLFTQLNRAVLGEGGLAEFADIAGMSMFEFQALAEESMAAAAQAVLEGLNDMSDAGKDQVKALDSVGLARDRVSRALISMSKNEAGLAKARKIANEELMRQSALQKEFETRQNTVAGQVDILKSKINSFAIRMGEALLPAIRKVVDFLGRFFDGLFFITMAAKNFFASLKMIGDGVHPMVKKGGALALLFTVFLKIKDVITFLITKLKGLFGFLSKAGPKVAAIAKGFGFLGKMATGAIGAVVAFAPAIAKFGDMQAIIDDFAGGVENLTDKFNILKTNGVGGLDQLTDDALKLMIEGMEEGALKDTLKEMFDAGNLDSDTVKNLGEFGKGISDEILGGMKDQFGVGAQGGAMGFDLANVTGFIDALEAEGQTTNQIYKDLVLIRDLLRANGGQHDDITRKIQQQIVAQLAFVEAGKDSKTNQEALVDLLFQAVDGINVTEQEFQNAIKTSKGLEKFARDFGMAIEGVPALVDILFPPAKDPVQEALLQLKEDASAFKQMVADVFAPTEAQFQLEFAEMDLADAHKEHADLHTELGDLHSEDAQLQQDLVDLQNQELLTHEEKLKIAEMQLENQELQNKHAQEAAMTLEETVRQQDLINEALEIEDRLRRGLSLSANDQLRREKLRKDLRRVELAAQQGSLEFADLEAEAIREKIKDVEKGAVTETDAILKRRKAADIEAKANLRREKEKEEIAKNIAEIQEINLESVARRNEEIIEIEKRRAEIEERLKEIPREIKEAHFDIHEAQKEVFDRTADIQIGFMEMRAVGEEEMKALAEALGMPMDKLDGMMTLLNHLRVESEAFIGDIITGATAPKGNFATSPSTGGPSVSDIQRKNYSFLQGGSNIVDFMRHGGGGFKTGNKFIAGEYGPELIKTFPGGGMVTPLANSRGEGMHNTINVNVSGLPSDPIAARKVAQTISRELQKLEREGRSGVIR